jgi:hypothetical protein
MKSRQVTAALFLLVLALVSGSASASDEVVGEWRGTVETDRGNYDVTMEFAMGEDGLSGTFTSTRDGVQDLDEVAWADGTLTFERIRVNPEGEAIPLLYSATLDGDTMKVTALSSGPWHRPPSPPAS